MENHRTLVSICEDYCKYNGKLALPDIPKIYAIKDFRKARQHETYWDNVFNCATFWPNHYETQGEYLILGELKKEPSEKEKTMKTVPNTLTYPENAVKITDIYGSEPVTIPGGWEFVRFGPLKEKDCWIDAKNRTIVEGISTCSINECRVIVRKAPKKLDPRLWMWLFTSRGEATKCITAVDIYGSKLDGKWNEEDIEDFRPPVKNEKYITIWGEAVRAYENYDYLSPRFILKS